MSATNKFTAVSFVLILLVVFVAIMPYAMHAQVVDIHFNAPSAVIVDDGIDWPMILESRHSDPGHIVRDNPQARVQVLTAIDAVKVAPPQINPDLDQVLCKAIQFAKGMYYAIWVAQSNGLGTVSVFNQNGWLTSFADKPRINFQQGRPNGAESWEIVPCDQIMPPPLATQ